VAAEFAQAGVNDGWSANLQAGPATTALTPTRNCRSSKDSLSRPFDFRRTRCTATLKALRAGSLPEVSRSRLRPRLPLGSSRRTATPATNSGDTRTALHQEVELAASASRIESALLDAKQFAAFSGLAATIDPREGGAFSLFGGLIVGRNIEIVSGQRIVQAWRPTHWDPGVYSVVKFAFSSPAAAVRWWCSTTRVSPSGDYDHLSSGWYAHYWEPLKKLPA